MSAQQKIAQGRGPLNINLASLQTPLKLAKLHNHSPLLAMVSETFDYFLKSFNLRFGQIA